MARWRPLEQYTPFARLLVEYMWAQRPPLLPNQFAARLGVRKQAVSTWLNSDATPPPVAAVRLARAMGLPVAEVLAAAGHATAADPLLDRAGAVDLAIAEIGRLGEDVGTPEQRAASLEVLRRVREAQAAAVSVAIPGDPTAPPPEAPPEGAPDAPPEAPPEAMGGGVLGATDQRAGAEAGTIADEGGAAAES